MIEIKTVLFPFSKIFKEGAYEQFVERWEKKKLTQQEIRTIECLLREYAYIFKREQLIESLEYTKNMYSMVLKRNEREKNAWTKAVGNAFGKIASWVDIRSKSGNMLLRLFTASLSVLRKELNPDHDKKRVSRSCSRKTNKKNQWETDPDDSNDKVDDISSMTIEEQIEKFDLHRDTYF